jgi:hypothetical protein
MLRLGLRTLPFLVAACSDGVGPRPVQSCAHDQEVELRVSTDPVPLFTWTPPCGLASLAVWDQNQTSGWVLYTGSRAAENPLRSGIRYGNAPPEALEPTPASPLTSGTYTVTVYRWIGDESGTGSLFPVGEATFER